MNKNNPNQHDFTELSATSDMPSSHTNRMNDEINTLLSERKHSNKNRFMNNQSRANNMSRNMDHNMGRGMSRNMAHNMGRGTGRNMGHNMSRNMSRNMGHNMSHNMGHNMGHNMSRNMSRNMGRNMDHNMSHDMSYDMSHDMGHDMNHASMGNRMSNREDFLRYNQGSRQNMQQNTINSDGINEFSRFMRNQGLGMRQSGGNRNRRRYRNETDSMENSDNYHQSRQLAMESTDFEETEYTDNIDNPDYYDDETEYTESSRYGDTDLDTNDYTNSSYADRYISRSNRGMMRMYTDDDDDTYTESDVLDSTTNIDSTMDSTTDYRPTRQSRTNNRSKINRRTSRELPPAIKKRQELRKFMKDNGITGGIEISSVIEKYLNDSGVNKKTNLDEAIRIAKENIIKDKKSGKIDKVINDFKEEFARRREKKKKQK